MYNTMSKLKFRRYLQGDFLYFRSLKKTKPLGLGGGKNPPPSDMQFCIETPPELSMGDMSVFG